MTKMMTLLTGLAASALGTSAMADDPIAIRMVEVAAPAINCGFDTSCRLTANDTVSPFTLPGHAGEGRFISRIGRHQPGTPGTYLSANGAYHLPSLTYRVDLSAMSVGDKCVHQVYVPWDSYRPQFDYDQDGRVTDTAFQITQGALGDVKVENAWIASDTDTLIIRFEGDGVCAGQSSYPFGFAAHGTTRVSETSALQAWGYVRSPSTGEDANFRVDVVYSGAPLTADGDGA